MRANDFGDWTKRITAVDSRRGIGWVLGAGVLGLMLAARGASEAEAAFGYCSAPGTPCSRNKKCCSGHCRKDGVCGCDGRGAPCINHVGIACCSQTCRNGKCR